MQITEFSTNKSPEQNKNSANNLMLKITSGIKRRLTDTHESILYAYAALTGQSEEFKETIRQQHLATSGRSIVGNDKEFKELGVFSYVVTHNPIGYFSELIFGTLDDLIQESHDEAIYCIYSVTKGEISRSSFDQLKTQDEFLKWERRVVLLGGQLLCGSMMMAGGQRLRMLGSTAFSSLVLSLSEEAINNTFSEKKVERIGVFADNVLENWAGSARFVGMLSKLSSVLMCLQGIPTNAQRLAELELLHGVSVKKRVAFVKAILKVLDISDDQQDISDSIRSQDKVGYKDFVKHWNEGNIWELAQLVERTVGAGAKLYQNIKDTNLYGKSGGHEQTDQYANFTQSQNEADVKLVLPDATAITGRYIDGKFIVRSENGANKLFEYRTNNNQAAGSFYDSSSRRIVLQAENGQVNEAKLVHELVHEDQTESWGLKRVWQKISYGIPALFSESAKVEYFVVRETEAYLAEQAKLNQMGFQLITDGKGFKYFKVEPNRNIEILSTEEIRAVLSKNHQESKLLASGSAKVQNYYGLQQRALKLIVDNECLPTNETQSTRVALALSGLTGTGFERKLQRKLGADIKTADPIKVLSKVKWPEVYQLLSEKLAAKRIYITNDDNIASINLADDIIVLNSKLLSEAPSSLELLQMLLVKEAVVILESQKQVQQKSKPLSILEKQSKGFLVAHGLYYMLFSDEKNEAPKIAMNRVCAQSYSDYLDPFKFVQIFFAAYINNRSSATLNAAAEKINKEVLPFITSDESLELKPQRLAIIATEPGDRMDPLNPLFLNPTNANPYQVIESDGIVTWKRIAPESKNELEIKFHPDVNLEEVTEEVCLLELNVKHGAEYSGRGYPIDSSIQLLVSKDPEYGAIFHYRVKGEPLIRKFGQIAQFEELRFPGEVVKFFSLLKQSLGANENQTFVARLSLYEELFAQGFMFIRSEHKSSYESGNSGIFSYSKKVSEVNAKLREAQRQAEMLLETQRREERALQQAEANRLWEEGREEREREFRERFNLENVTIRIRRLGATEDEYILPAFQRLRDIGFIHIHDENEMSCPYSRIEIFIGTEMPEKKETGLDRLLKEDRNNRAFWYDPETKLLRELSNPIFVSKPYSWSEPKVYRERNFGYALTCSSAEMAAEFVAKISIPDLREKRKNKAPLEVSGFVNLSLDQSLSPVSITQDRQDQMMSLLRAAETMIQIQSDEERRQAQSSYLEMYGAPRYEWKEGKPYFIFEDYSHVGYLNIKEDDEVEVIFTKINGSTFQVRRAVVIESKEGKIVTTVPNQIDLKRDLNDIASVSIRKSYNDVTSNIQLEFLRKVIEDPYQFNTVAIALGLIEPSFNENLENVGFVQLENPRIGEHPEQVQAIARAINGLNIEQVWGPPGTGKTTVSAEIIFQNFLLGRSQLIAAQTNRAVDTLLLKAKEKGVKVYRLGNHPQIIDSKLRGDHIRANAPRKPLQPKEDASGEVKAKYDLEMYDYQGQYQRWIHQLVEEIRTGKAVIGGTIAGIAIDPTLREVMRVIDRTEGYAFRFSQGIIEEASTASFAELLLAFSKVRDRVVVSGDYKQLGVSPLDREIEDKLRAAHLTTQELETLQKSLFEFLYAQNSFPITMLKANFRSTQRQVDVTNFWYGDELRAMKDVPRVINDNSLIIIDTAKLGNSEAEDGTSYNNLTEVEIIKAILSFLEAPLDAKDLGLISPYKAQNSKIWQMVQRLLKDARASKEVMDTQRDNLGTVYPIQGREFPVAVVSAVRSNDNGRTGFSTGQMWNVMTSRGELINIVIFDSRTFLASRTTDIAAFISHMISQCAEGRYIQLEKGKEIAGLKAAAAFISESLKYLALPEAEKQALIEAEKK